MFLKMMGPHGGSSIRDSVRSCTFHQRGDAKGFWATITDDDGSVSQIMIEGNVYVMNAAGVTIDKFIHAKQ